MPRVRVAHDDIERFALCKPCAAIEEIIWNGLDAGGTRVDVTFQKRVVGDALEVVDAIEVRDFGAGIPHSEIDEDFGSVGGSTKTTNRMTPEGRVRHGQFGRGRFTFLVLGNRAVWTTTYLENGKMWTYDIVISRSHPEEYEFSSPVEVAIGQTGTTVRIDDLLDAAKELLNESTLKHLHKQLAFYLVSYPDVDVTYDGAKFDVRDAVERTKKIELSPSGPNPLSADLVIIEWASGTRAETSKLVLCDQRRFAVSEIPSDVSLKEINATAYLTSKAIGDLHQSGGLGMGELNQSLADLAKLARQKLRGYVRRRLAEQSENLIKQWQDEKIYPYKNEPNGFAERAERQVFDVLAFQIHQFHRPFRKGTREAKQLTLELVRQALESKPTALHRILAEVLRLPKKRQQQMADLIERTGLDALIEANSVVLDRLDTIEAFRHILFNKDWRAKLRERTQLHRLLVHELWLFGEEYELDTDDEALRKVLEAHINLLNRNDLASDVDPDTIDIEEKIPDLMLTRRIKRGRELFEHLVIELKNPRVKAETPQVSQIEEVARLVSNSKEFSNNSERVKWTFILVVNELGEHGKFRLEGASLGGGLGCIWKSNVCEVRLVCWNDILHEAQLRYEFFRDGLKVEPSSDFGMKRFMKLHRHLMTGKGMTKKGEIAAGKLKQ